MIYYHGTTKKAAKQIFKDKMIKITDNSISRYCSGAFNDTENGYVYISDILNIAWGYAVNKNDDTSFCVFKLDLNENEVEIDKDNEKEYAIVSELYQSGEGCYRINRNLLFGSDVIAYVLVKCENREQRDYIADNEKIEQLFTNHWKSIRGD